jgi:hypothetical protein
MAQRPGAFRTPDRQCHNAPEQFERYKRHDYYQKTPSGVSL